MLHINIPKLRIDVGMAYRLSPDTGSHMSHKTAHQLAPYANTSYVCNTYMYVCVCMFCENTCNYVENILCPLIGRWNPILPYLKRINMVNNIEAKEVL